MVQLQNLPQNKITDLAEVRGLVQQGNYEAVQLLYDDIPDTLSQLIRTAFVPRKGMKFIVDVYKRQLPEWLPYRGYQFLRKKR